MAKAQSMLSRSASPGRPRDPKRTEAVLAAARDLIMESGYAAATIQAISERSGVSRPTIYQRWGDRISLIEEALYADPLERDAPSTGSLGGDLLKLVAELVQDMRRPEMLRGMSALHAEVLEVRGSEGRYWAPTLDRWGIVFEAAADRGEISRGSATKKARVALQMALGSLFLMARDKRYSTRQLSREITSVLLGGVGLKK
ncbi:MAG: TetR/AcrR family transcriptional regulator [Myxococcota bacterium]